MTLGVLIGTCMIVSAQDSTTTPQRPNRPHGPPSAEMIKKFDKDGDGKLSDEERKAMQEAGKAKREEHQKAMLAKYDKDGDGKLSDEERAAAKADREAEMLKKFDKDGDGKLSDEERAAMPKHPGRPGRPGGRGGRGGPKGPKGSAENPPANPPAE